MSLPMAHRENWGTARIVRDRGKADMARPAVGSTRSPLIHLGHPRLCRGVLGLRVPCAENLPFKSRGYKFRMRSVSSVNAGGAEDRFLVHQVGEP